MRGRRKKTVPTTIAGVIALLIGLAITQWQKSAERPRSTPPTPSNSAESLPRKVSSSVGWTGKASLQSHYQKHGREFGEITIDQYLQKAKALRDLPKTGAVLEIVRTDGVITRFHKPSGEFIAFNPDRTIRTFFRPDDGERYFRRQAEREQSDE